MKRAEREEFEKLIAHCTGSLPAIYVSDLERFRQAWSRYTGDEMAELRHGDTVPSLGIRCYQSRFVPKDEIWCAVDHEIARLKL